MQTHTLESKPQSDKNAMSTPKELDYDAIIRTCAKRKVDNGAQFSSTKGKASLQIAVNNMLYSLLNIAKFDADNKAVSLPLDVFNAGKAAIESFWKNEARDMIEQAIQGDAKINIRRGVLMTRIDSKGNFVRSKTDKITAIHKATAAEYKLCDTFGLTAAKARLDTMLDNVGKYSRDELQTQRNIVIKLEQSITELSREQAAK